MPAQRKYHFFGGGFGLPDQSPVAARYARIESRPVSGGFQDHLVTPAVIDVEVCEYFCFPALQTIYFAAGCRIKAFSITKVHRSVIFGLPGAGRNLPHSRISLFQTSREATGGGALNAVQRMPRATNRMSKNLLLKTMKTKAERKCRLPEKGKKGKRK
jgi:hypothetical protein